MLFKVWLYDCLAIKLVKWPKQKLPFSMLSLNLHNRLVEVWDFQLLVFHKLLKPFCVLATSFPPKIIILTVKEKI